MKSYHEEVQQEQLVLHKVRADHMLESAEAGIPEVRMGSKQQEAE